MFATAFSANMLLKIFGITKKHEQRSTFKTKLFNFCGVSLEKISMPAAGADFFWRFQKSPVREFEKKHCLKCFSGLCGGF